MENVEKVIMAVFGGVIVLAIWSVIVSKKAQTPQVIQAASTALSQIVAAAVNPIATASTNGNLGLNPFSLPSH